MTLIHLRISTKRQQNVQEAPYLKTIATNRKVDSYRDFRDEVRPTRRNRDYKLVSAVARGGIHFSASRNTQTKGFAGWLRYLS